MSTKQYKVVFALNNLGLLHASNDIETKRLVFGFLTCYNEDLSITILSWALNSRVKYDPNSDIYYIWVYSPHPFQPFTSRYITIHTDLQIIKVLEKNRSFTTIGSSKNKIYRITPLEFLQKQRILKRLKGEYTEEPKITKRGKTSISK